MEIEETGEEATCLRSFFSYIYVFIYIIGSNIYSDGNSEVFWASWATRSTDYYEIWHSGGDKGANFTLNLGYFLPPKNETIAKLANSVAL